MTLNSSTACDLFIPISTSFIGFGDLVRILAADNSNFLDTTISSVTDGAIIVLAASAAAFAPGDLIFLRGQTASYNLINNPFEWARTQFLFGTTNNWINSGYTSATPVPHEQGSKWKIMHKFEKKGLTVKTVSWVRNALPLRKRGN